MESGRDEMGFGGSKSALCAAGVASAQTADLEMVRLRSVESDSRSRDNQCRVKLAETEPNQGYPRWTSSPRLKESVGTWLILGGMKTVEPRLLGGMKTVVT